jgi:thiol-disulfide isomerase/thioredoxin
MIATTALAVVLAAALVASYLPSRGGDDGAVVELGPSPTFALDSLTGPAPAGGSLDGRALPDATLATLTGSADRKVRLADVAGGRPAVVNIWSSACVPCQRETPDLVAVWRDLQARGADVAFVGVDVQDTPTDGMAFLRRYGGDAAYPMLSDPSAGFAYELGTTTLPTTVLVDPQGRVVASHFGAITPDRLRALLHQHFGVL